MGFASANSGTSDFPRGKGMDLWSEVSITSITILKEYLGGVAGANFC